MIIKKKEDNSVVLVISDLHAPYTHPDAIDFLAAIKSKYKPTRVISTGDELDYHSYSFHEHNPNLPAPSDELKQGILAIRPLYEMFPVVDVLHSNHGSLVFRKALDCGLPTEVFKTYREILQAPKGWNWHEDLTIQLPTGYHCYFHHSKSANALKTSQIMGMSHVSGHLHESFNIQYWANPIALHFAMIVGCLVDKDSLSMAYNKNNLKRPIIGCGIIINGIPQLIPMTLNTNGRWNKKLS